MDGRQVLVGLLPHFFWKTIFALEKFSLDIKTLPKIKAGIWF